MSKLLEDKIVSRKAIVGIVGMGYVGLPLAKVFIDAGFTVHGCDVDSEKINKLASGTSYIEHVPSTWLKRVLADKTFWPSDRQSALGLADAILICVPTPVTKSKEPDMQFIVSTGKMLANVLSRNKLVVLESTTYPGTTRDVLAPLLEVSGYKAGTEFHLAYSPEREDPGSGRDTSKIPKVVGGIDEESTRLASLLYGAAFSQVVTVKNCEEAEAAKVWENTYRAINIAAVNEFKTICDKLGLDVWAVIKAAATKPFGFQAFYPGPGWGGHCLAGNVGIPLLNGTTIAIRELVNKRPWVYSITADGNIRPGHASKVWQSGEKSLLRIHFDKDGYLDCTPDHLVMLRNGDYRPAGALEINDSIMPLNRRLDKDGYERVYNPSNCNYLWTHRIVGEAMHGAKRGVPVHHRDEDKRNNTPKNLQPLSVLEHQLLHVRTPERREKSRQAMLRNWQNPEYRKKVQETQAINGRIQAAERIVKGKQGFQKRENHKVIAIEKLQGKQPVFDMYVPKYHNFAVAAGVFVHNCIPCDPFYLSWLAKQHGTTSRFIELAGEVNTQMHERVVAKVAEALNKEAQSIMYSRIGILGIAYKKDVDDPRESPAFPIMEQLHARGARLSYHDPHIPKIPKMRDHFCPDLVHCATEFLVPWLQAQDCVVIVTDHSAVDYSLVGKHARHIVDTRNCIPAEYQSKVTRA